MKARLLLLAVFLFSGTALTAQVGINIENPDPSSALDIHSTDKGLLIPRVNLSSDLNSASPISDPADGLLIYNSGANQAKGFYFWNGSKWNNLSESEGNLHLPDVSTDQAIVLFSGTSGDSIRNSGILIDDFNNITGIEKMQVNDTLTITALKIAGFSDPNKVMVTDENGNTSWVDPEMISSLDITENNDSVAADVHTLNFEGMVDVTDNGNNSATINISPKLIQVYNTSQVDLNTHSGVAIPWDDADFQDNEVFTHSSTANNSRIEVEQDGVYELSYHLNVDVNSGNSNVVRIRILKNGTTYHERGSSYHYSRWNNSPYESMSINPVYIQLNANDYIEIIADREKGNGNVKTRTGESFLTMKLIRSL